MRLKCDDGITRRFSIAHIDGDYLPGGTRQNGGVEAFCEECGYPFGYHDTHILKPQFRDHICKREVVEKGGEIHEHSVGQAGR